MSQPATDCGNARATRLGQLQTSVGNSVSSDASFDSPQALQQQRANVLAATSVTTSYGTEVFNFSQQCSVGPVGGGGCQLFWDEHIVCSLDLVTPSQASAPNEACGCAP